ncbi:MAG TPA: helix-turn-helix domain-containing protein [Leptolyngbyaceae cyanobacterium M65_K2018_010]|nr:helix-turn-helix domain-containing protein [Leptolyngbyaceae cyanobacterium M65_K2018_010]
MANLAPTQVEQLQNIGAYLRQVRQDQGIPLDVLANQIFIRPALLQALEAGRGDQLPEPVFIQGFIRRYAEALGLDGKAISQEFLVTPVEVIPTPELVTLATANGNGSSAAEPLPQPEAVQPVKVFEKPRPRPVERSNRPSSLPLWLGLGAVALVVGGLLWALQGRNPAPRTGETPSDSTAEVAAEPPIPNSEALAPLELSDPEISQTLEAPIVVKINLSDRAWLSVVADGKTLYEGTPDQGYEETWTAQNSLVFRTGNAGAVSLSVNGDRPVVLGNAGQVRTLTLTPDSKAEALQAGQ